MPETIRVLSKDEAYQSPTVDTVEIPVQGEEFVDQILEYIGRSSFQSVESSTKPPRSADPAPLFDGVRTKSVILRLLPASLEIRGQEFEITLAGRQVWLSHPRWSLVGQGSSLLEAEHEIVEMARTLLPTYLKFSTAEMTEEAVVMRDFMLSIVHGAR